jgi:hypothetical protein
MTQKLLKATESTAFLIGEVVFCLAFLSSCEIPNWVSGPRSPNECADRWMFTAAVFVPSGLQAGRSGSIPAPRTDPDTI